MLCSIFTIFNRHKMKEQCSKYSLKMENTKIFQKDGKDEYIPNGW